MACRIFLSSTNVEIDCAANDIETQQQIADFYPIHNNRSHTKFIVSPHLTPEVLEKLRGITEDNISTAPLNVQGFFNAEINRRRVTEELLLNGPSGSCKVNEHLILEPHQGLGREISWHNKRYGFFYDTRTGKTPMSLTIINDDLLEHPEHKWLIICPLILIDNAWIEDANKFFPDMKIISCHATTPQRRRERMCTIANVYVTNTESFANYADLFKQMNIYGCFVDESSSMKNHSSKTSKTIVDFAQTMERFYLLSGTPAPNGEWEYYMQLKALDFYGIQQSYTQFKERYFTNVSFNPQYEKLSLRPDRTDELHSLIKSHALYVDQSVLDLPGRDFEEVVIELPTPLKDQYTLLKKELYLEVSEGNVILASNAATKLNKLNQVTSGFIIDTALVKANKFGRCNDANYVDVDTTYILDLYRFKALEELLQRPGIAGEQVLIWCTYRKEFEILREMYKGNCACIYGATSLEEKSKAITEFKAGKVQYLFANPASADKGLTLTNTHIAIYFSLTWSYELFKQSKERIYGAKRSQPKFCHYYILIARGTIDRILYSDVLANKGQASLAVLNHLRSDKF